jgi:hypothetical protein
MSHLSREAEADRILRAYGPEELPEIMAMLERQFTVLHNRAQVLLGLCGIVVTTTGFSGRLVAGTSAAAQWMIIVGVAFSLLAAAVVVWGVLHLYWLTMQPGDTTRAWLLMSLAYRDKKTRAYRIGIILLLIGLTIYAGALAIMLLYPRDNALPAR